jgi:hypothetical protein
LHGQPPRERIPESTTGSLQRSQSIVCAKSIRVDTWLQGLHQACIRAHTKMILDKQRRDHTKKDNSGKLLAAIRDLQLVLKTPDGEAWDNSVDLQQRHYPRYHKSGKYCIFAAITVSIAFEIASLIRRVILNSSLNVLS